MSSPNPAVVQLFASVISSLMELFLDKGFKEGGERRSAYSSAVPWEDVSSDVQHEVCLPVCLLKERGVDLDQDGEVRVRKFERG
jgi:hypothetical protein